MFAKNKTKREINLLETISASLIPFLFFFSSIFIIGRFINVQFILAIIIASSIGSILMIIVWNLIGGSPKSPNREIATWAGAAGRGLNNTWQVMIFFIPSIIITIAYPVIVGINYFSLDSNQEIQIMILKYSSIYILINHILALPISIIVLSSSFIDEDTRANVFLGNFGGLFSTSLFISILFWIFNMGTIGSSFSLGNINLVYSPKLLIILTGYLFIFLVLPYFIGIQKAKRLKKDFLKTEISLLRKIIDEINLSTDKDIISKIKKIKKEINDKVKEFVSADTGVAVGIMLDNIEKEEDISVRMYAPNTLTFYCYKIARSYDTRFKFYDFLKDIDSDITHLKKRLENEQLNREETTILCDKYVEHFKEKEKIKENEKKEKPNPALWIGILFILSPLTGQILSEIGRYLIDIFKHM